MQGNLATHCSKKCCSNSLRYGLECLPKKSGPNFLGGSSATGGHIVVPVITRYFRTGSLSTTVYTDPCIALLLELSSWIGLILHSIGWQGEFGLNAVSTFYWFYCYGDSLAQIWEICMRDKNFQYVMIQLTKKTLLISAMAIPTSSSSFSEKWCGEIKSHGNSASKAKHCLAQPNMHLFGWKYVLSSCRLMPLLFW